MRKLIICLLLIFPLITFPIHAEGLIEIYNIYDLLNINKELYINE